MQYRRLGLPPLGLFFGHGEDQTAWSGNGYTKRSGDLGSVQYRDSFVVSAIRVHPFATMQHVWPD